MSEPSKSIIKAAGDRRWHDPFRPNEAGETVAGDPVDLALDMPTAPLRPPAQAASNESALSATSANSKRATAPHTTPHPRHQFATSTGLRRWLSNGHAFI